MQMHKLVDWYLLGDSPERMAAVAGIDRSQGNDTLKAIVPFLVTAISEHAEHPEGQQQILEAIQIIPRFETVKEALDAENGIAKLQRAGANMAPTLLDEQHSNIAKQVARKTGAKEEGVKQMIDMALTLLLGRLGYQEASPTSLLPLLLGTGAVSINAEDDNANDTGRISTLENRRRGLPLWLIWLLPLLLVGGCLYTQRERLSGLSIDTKRPSGTNTDLSQRSLVVGEPANGETVPSHFIELKGTGPIGKSFSVWRDNRKLGRFTVDKAGNWQVKLKDIPELSGETKYILRSEKGEQIGEHLLNLEREIEIVNPAPQESAPSAGFLMNGTGKKPNTTYQLFENGASLGNFTVDGEGQWKINILAAEPGVRTYVVVNQEGHRMGSLKLNIQQVQSTQNCDAAMSISMATNQQINAPFRFGGVGSSSRYVVTVWRGKRRIGTKYVALRSDCTWNYFSDPGGQKDQLQAIRYEVRPVNNSRREVKRLALQVMGSGSNYDQYGRYTGPKR